MNTYENESKILDQNDPLVVNERDRVPNATKPKAVKGPGPEQQWEVTCPCCGFAWRPNRSGSPIQKHECHLCKAPLLSNYQLGTTSLEHKPNA